MSYEPYGKHSRSQTVCICFLTLREFLGDSCHQEIYSLGCLGEGTLSAPATAYRVLAFHSTVVIWYSVFYIGRRAHQRSPLQHTSRKWRTLRHPQRTKHRDLWQPSRLVWEGLAGLVPTLSRGYRAGHMTLENLGHFQFASFIPNTKKVTRKTLLRRESCLCCLR